MKTFKKLLVLTFMFILLSCKNSTIKNHEQLKGDTVSYNAQDSKYIDTSFSVNTNNPNDSIALDNDIYRIVIIPHIGEVGDLVGVYNKITKKSFSIDEGDSYYVSVVDSFIIIDSGTSASRGISIYNLNNFKIVFSGSYQGGIDIDKKIVKFNTPVELPDSLKPKCPDNFKDYGNTIGYLELQLFDLQKLILIKTGQYECCLFE